MGEHRILVDKLKLEYEGALVANDVFRIITDFLQNRGYEMLPASETEVHTPQGKGVDWYIAPWKKITDYVRLEMKVTVLMHNLVKKEVTIEGKKAKIDNGKVIVVIHGNIEYDYDRRWEDKPMFLFIRTIVNKYVFPTYTKKFEQLLIDDANNVYGSLQDFFNMSRSRVLTHPPSTVRQPEHENGHGH